MLNSSAQWYFAFGSNLCESVFLRRRGIHPLESRVVKIDTHCLCFNVLFVPYLDPAMAGLAKRREGEVAVHGVAYLLSDDDFVRMIVSEG